MAQTKKKNPTPEKRVKKTKTKELKSGIEKTGVVSGSGGKRGDSTHSQKRALYVSLFAVSALVIYTFSNHIVPIVTGAILAGAFYPLLFWLTGKGLSRKTAAVLISLLITVSITLPFVYITVQLSKEVYSLYLSFQKSDGLEGLYSFLYGDSWLANSMRDMANYLGFDYSRETIETLFIGGVKSLLKEIFTSVNSLVTNFLSFLFKLILMQIFIFALFVEGPAIKKFMLQLFPMNDQHEQTVIDTVNSMNFATLIFNGIGGVIQGGLAGIGFWVAGLSSITLWTTLMIILAFIPLVGISIVTVPASLYLLLTGKTVTALILFVYCTTVALVTENWFKPLFIGKKVQINPYLMFFSIIGGMSVFGIMGIFFGPIIMAIFLTLSGIYFRVKKNGSSGDSAIKIEKK